MTWCTRCAPRYRNNAQWVTSKLVLAALRKYKDTTNQYLWQPALTAGQPATFMGYGITEAEDMPAVGAGAFSPGVWRLPRGLPDRRPCWHAHHP